MNLVYIDESGNTGLNLKDPQQPVFLLAAMILPESRWFPLEKLFLKTASDYFGDPLPDTFEIQAKDLKNKRGIFEGLTFAQQLSFRDRMLQLLLDNKIVVNIIEKGFFIDSSKSFALQLVDLAAYYIRKYEENKLGLRVSEIDKQTFGKIRELVSTGIGSSVVDVLEWVKSQYIK